MQYSYLHTFYDVLFPENEFGDDVLLWTIKNDPKVFGFVLWPQVSFFMGAIINEILGFAYRAGESKITFNQLSDAFKKAFASPQPAATFTKAEAVIGLANRFLSPRPSLKHYKHTLLRRRHSSGQLSSLLGGAQIFFSPRALAESFSRSDLKKIYQDVVTLAVAVNCLDDNTMQRVFVSASQAGLRIDEFMTILDLYNIGDIWDGLTPEEAARGAFNARKNHSGSRQRRHAGSHFQTSSSGNERTRKLSIFGLTAVANLKDLKKAYRKMAIKYHPDRNTGSKDAEKTATEKMAELNIAYDWLIENW